MIIHGIQMDPYVVALCVPGAQESPLSLAKEYGATSWFLEERLLTHERDFVASFPTRDQMRQFVRCLQVMD